MIANCNLRGCTTRVVGNLCACAQAMAQQGWWYLRLESVASARTARVCPHHAEAIRSSKRGALRVEVAGWHEDRVIDRPTLLERGEGCTQEHCLEVTRPRAGIGSEVRLETVRLPGVALVARLCSVHVRALLRGEPLTPTRWTEDLAAARAIMSLLPSGELGRGRELAAGGGGHVHDQ